MPAVTVVIPTYNHAHFLKEALQSVVDQTFTDWEAIVVNNFSEDDTIEVVNTFADERIRLINFANNGVIAASRNVGIKKSNSEWIAFLDSDDLWEPKKLEKCIPQFSSADLIAHRMEVIKNGCVIGVSPPVRSKDFSTDNLIFKRNCLTPTAVIVRKTCLIKVGYFSERDDFATAEDFELWIKLSKENMRFEYIPEILSKYRQHGGNSSGSVTFHMNSVFKVLKTHYDLLNDKTLWNQIRYRRITAIQYYGAGRNFQKQEDYTNAIRYCSMCLKKYPFFMKNIAVLSFLFFKKIIEK